MVSSRPYYKKLMELETWEHTERNKTQEDATETNAIGRTMRHSHRNRIRRQHMSTDRYRRHPTGKINII